MRRILYLDHTAKMGGGEIALINLIDGIDRTKFEPIVVLGSDGPVRTKLCEAGVDTHVIPLGSDIVDARKDGLGAGYLLKLRQVSGLLGYVFRLARWARTNRIDIIHTNSLKSDIYGGIAGKLARIPVIWHVRDHIDGEYLPGPVARVFRALANTLPTRVVTISGSTLRRLRPKATETEIAATINDDELSERCVVIHDGCIPEVYAGDRSATAHEKAGGPIIALIGRISPWKGQDVFIRAAAEIHERFPTARFWIIGSPLFGEEALEQELKEMVRQLGLEGCIEFLGYRTDVPELMQQADIIVHASTLGEPFGQVVIEGMAAGKPVIATDGGAIPEIVVDGTTGLIVPMKDSSAMAEAMATLLSSPEKARTMGAAGRDRVQQAFTIERTATKVQRLYDRVLH